MTDSEKYIEKFYSNSSIKNTILILHPEKLDEYGITHDDFYWIFEEGSKLLSIKKSYFRWLLK